MHISGVDQLLNDTYPMVRHQRARWRKTASGFKGIALFDPKEVVQTRVIAGLLDPGGNHGQGDLFLKRFLEEIGETPPDYLESARFDLEFMTRLIEADRRRIDLLITLPSGRMLALESKARGAVDQPKQIQHYLACLDELAPKNHLLIYLSPKGKKPRNVSDKQWRKWTEEGIVRCFDYRETVGRWLGKCRDECKEAVVLCGFLDEFGKLTDLEDERSPLMSNEFKDKVAAHIVASKENLVASIAVNNARDAVRRELAKKFLTALHKEIDESPNEKWNVTREDNGEGYLCLFLRGPDWGKTFRVAFEIGPDEKVGKQMIYEWHRSIGLGVSGGGKKNCTQGVQQCAERIRLLLEKMMPGGKTTDSWIYFRPEFDKMSLENVACLLNEPPPEIVRRLADELKSIAAEISSEVDAFEARAKSKSVSCVAPTTR